MNNLSAGSTPIAYIESAETQFLSRRLRLPKNFFSNKLKVDARYLKFVFAFENEISSRRRYPALGHFSFSNFFKLLHAEI